MKEGKLYKNVCVWFCNFNLPSVPVLILPHSLGFYFQYQDVSLYLNTVELGWLEHLWNHVNMFETGVVRANECQS